MKLFGGVGALAALLCLACLARPSEAIAACKLGKLAELAITMHGTRPWTTVQIDGKDASFILDSGAFYSSITPAKAAELGLSLKPAPWGLFVTGIGGDAANVSVATVKTLTLSGIPLPRVEFLVLGQGNDGSAGLLGQNFLHIADDDYDLAHGVVRLLKPIDCGRSVLTYWDQGGPYSAVEKLTAREKDYHTYAYVTVNGVRLRATLDTGANASVISSHAAARAGLTPQMEGAKLVGSSSGVGSHLIRTWSVPVGVFKFGDEEVKNTRMQIAGIELSDSDMLLGADFFLSHHVYVSNSQDKIYFTYNGGNVFNLTAPLRAPDRPEDAAVDPAAPPAAQPGAVQAQAPNAAPGPAAGPAAGPDEPRDADGYSRRGAALAARKDYDAAIRDFDKAIALAPDDARYFYQRALAHISLKQPFLAMADLDETLKRQPDNTDALLSRGELKITGQDRAGAGRDLDAASSALPVQSDTRLRLAQDEERLERFDQVISEIDRWLPSHQDEAQTAQAYNMRCWARAHQGKDLDKALDDCNHAIRTHRTPGALENRGLVFLRRGEFDRAIDDYDAALKLRPNLAWALYGRGVARISKGDSAGGADIAAAKAIAPRIAEITRARGILVPAATATPAAAAPSPPAAPSP